MGQRLAVWFFERLMNGQWKKFFEGNEVETLVFICAVRVASVALHQVQVA